MSTTKPPAGYDDRFVVPLEPSRRGAHRARVSPAVGVLPVVAVIAVVAVVVVLAWTVLGRSGGNSDTNAVQTGSVAPGQATSQPAQPAPSDTVSTPPASTPAGTPDATGASAPADGVARDVTVTVLNSTARTGLARKAATLLNGKGWTAAHFATTPKVTARTTTTVFYATTAQKAVADALVADLGLGTVRKSTQFGVNAVTVVLGSDYPA